MVPSLGAESEDVPEQYSQDDQFHILGQYGKTMAGLYIGPRFGRADAGISIVEKMLQSMEYNTASLSALQTCNSTAQDAIGLAISTNECPSDSDESTEVSDTTVPKAPTTVATSGLRRGTPILRARAATCETTQVGMGDSYLYSTLVEGQHVCCSEGDLPDFSPDPFGNGTCYTHQVQTGEPCAFLAAEWSLKQEDLETFNEDTWGDPPFPAPIPNAICGPQVPGTEIANDSSSAGWALLNPCPLDACCNINGWCGITPEFCEYEDSGAPGTGICVSNCGKTVVNDDVAPDQFSKVGYFLASNLNRECLTMNAYEIKGSDYTHIQFAFGNINDDFSIGLMEGDEHQFAYFKTMRSLKRVISFGGWDFSTFPDTYHIFRNGVKEENRETIAQNVVDFVNEHGLDGVDFDWECPGAPDIPGIPPGEEEEGKRYLEFLKSLLMAAPASSWCLQGFPIQEIGALVDYIVFMIYDLRGQWDYGSNDPPLSCPYGNCLRSHVNSTETEYDLAMITKAQVQTRKLMVGVSSYGRSFEMSEAGCTGPTCTYTGNGAAEGRCTKTPGYLANAEINELLDDNDGASHTYDEDSDSDIMVYNYNQWVAYMTDETRDRRIKGYSGMNMGGSVEWSIDLQRFTASNWVTHLFNGTDEMSCDLFPDGPCDFPNPDTCEEMKDNSPSLYWAQFVATNYFQHIEQYGSMFDAEVLGTLLDVKQLVEDFPIKTSELSQSSNIFGIFSGALGLLVLRLV
ncbi:glycoside hydrolase superfamily [Aspergillus stella-maris]|uniref:glycoside hydrolase superfamily n=1 Tax=Aspergillus stella-maris TaxID=1810926 RepID=UPI003CCDBC1C